MKHYFYFIIAILSLTSMFSCDKDDEENNSEVWKTANEQAFNAIKTNSEYKELPSPGNEGSVYYKVLTEGTDTKPIYYTSMVSVYVKGYFVVGNDKLNIKKNDIFQRKEFNDGSPIYISVSAPDYLPRGVSISLQKMKKGDKWEIWMPYQLGWGSTTGKVPFDLYNTQVVVSIPAYSTVVYEIEVVNVIQ